MRILFLFIFLGIVSQVSCADSVKMKNDTELVEVWIKEGWPPEEIQAPVGFEVTPNEAFQIVARSKKLSIKHHWVCYRNDKNYYIADSFLHPKNHKKILKYSIVIDGMTGKVKGEIDLLEK